MYGGVTNSPSLRIYVLCMEKSSGNSLPNWVVTISNTKTFKTRLDQYWQHQDIIYDLRAQIHGTGSRSEVSRVNV